MRHALARTALLVVCAVTLVGCGLRLETSDVAPPSPGPAELARARTVVDAQTLVYAASALAPAADETLSPVLADIAAFSTAHVDALGGVYDSGLPTSTPPPDPTPLPVPSSSELLDQLAAATTTAATDTDQVDDPDLAQVLGSVTTARGELTARLAEALGVETPSTAPAPPPSDSSDPVVATGLALAHDQAGYAFEVVAARAPTGSDLRTAAQTAAEHHRAQATVWARTGGFDGTVDDPRRAQYQLPDDLDDPTTVGTLAVELEQAVAQAAAAALTDAAPGTRADLLTDLRAATAAATGWGAAPEPLPGLPS
ncbi:MAG: ferritin-like domain-containing protein [Micrococcales bacterium]|nr:ferritin-like domain-containing protein [Micrococcales bacterium]